MNVEVCKVKLLDVLNKNAAKHELELELMFKVYREGLIKAMLEHCEYLNTGGEVKPFRYDKPFPESYLDSYNKAIGMINNHVKDTVVLDSKEYNNFMNDVWDFTRLYGATRGGYAVELGHAGLL